MKYRFYQFLLAVAGFVVAVSCATIATEGTVKGDLMDAAAKGHTETVKALLAEGVDVNTKDKNGMTPLMTAASIGYTEIVKALLAEGADVNTRSRDGMTPLMAAEKKGYTDIVQLLKKAGAKE